MMAIEPRNNNWMNAARHITHQELLEFINLWSLLKNVTLRSHVKDSVSWKWEQSWEYSAGSAYKIQFRGSYPLFKTGQLWQAKAEQKLKLFGWAALQHKIPTADLLATRGMQPNLLCPLCNSSPKDTRHFLTDCNFSKGILHFIWAWFHFHGAPPLDSHGLATWISAAAAAGCGASNLRWSTDVLLYCW
jgi:hypothetical protein